MAESIGSTEQDLAAEEAEAGNPLGGKRGISGPDASKDVKALSKKHVVWAQDTSVHGKGKIGNYKEGVHFVPMIWGKGNLEHEANRVVKSPMLIAFDNPGQQNLSPHYVAGVWPKIEAVAKKAGVKVLVAPSVNWAQGTFGKPHEWYKEFFKHCGHCRVDGIAITVYTCAVGQMKERIEALKGFKKDIYVTAFACGDNPKEIEADDGRKNTKGSKSWSWQCEYIRDVVPFLEHSLLVKGYAWHSQGEPGRPNGYLGESALVNAGGAITALGKCYFGVSKHKVKLGVGGKEVENHSPQSNHRHPPLRGFDPIKAGACKVHQRVKCPHSNAMCDRESCCPDGTACPSSAPGWASCPKGRSLDCTHWPWSKMGIAQESVVHKAELKALTRTNISWAADWTIHAQKHYDHFLNQDHVLYLPMYWGKKTDSFQGRDGPIWLGFNEPNDPNQAHMDPWQAAKLWPEVEKMAAKHSVHTLVGPSVNFASGKWNDPIGWYDHFLKACKGCRVDAVNMHVYSCSLEQMKARIEMAKKYKKPIWITEFACADNPELIPHNARRQKSWHWQCEYMKQVIPYLNSEPSVAAYAWFSYGLPGKPDHYVGESGLIDQGRITPLGRCYSQLAGVKDTNQGANHRGHEKEGFKECGDIYLHKENQKCRGDVEWAFKKGRTESWAGGDDAYGKMKAVVGVSYDKATLQDFQRFWHCARPADKRCNIPPCYCTKPPCNTCLKDTPPAEERRRRSPPAPPPPAAEERRRRSPPAPPPPAAEERRRRSSEEERRRRSESKNCAPLSSPENKVCKGETTWAWQYGKHANWAATAYKNIKKVAGVDHKKGTLADYHRLYYCQSPGKKCAKPPCECSRPPCDTCR